MPPRWAWAACSLAALALPAAQAPASQRPQCRLAVVVSVGEAEVGLLHAVVGALAPVPDDVKVLLLDVARASRSDPRVGCARSDSESQCGHSPERRPTIELVASGFANVNAVADTGEVHQPAGALAAAALDAGCEHTLFLSHAVLLQGGLEQFTTQMMEPLGKPLPPWPPTTVAGHDASAKLGASAGPVGAVGAKLLRVDGTIAHAGFGFVPTARPPPPPPPPPPPYSSSDYGSSSYASGDWSSFDSVDYAPSYRVGGLDKNKNKKKTGYTSWRDAEPLDAPASGSPVDDYLMNAGDGSDEGEEDDEDEMKLYGYVEEESERRPDDGGGSASGRSVLDTLGSGLNELAASLGPSPPPPEKKKRVPKSMATAYHRLAGMPGTHPAASGATMGVAAVSAQALLLRTEMLGDALTAIEQYKRDGESAGEKEEEGENEHGGERESSKGGSGGGGRACGSAMFDGSVDWRGWGVELGLGAGLSMMLRRAGYAVALAPSATAILLGSPGANGGALVGNGGVPSHTAAAATGFRDAFDADLMGLLTADYMLAGKVGVLYSMECGSPETLGFTMEALGFVLALRHVLPIKLEVREWTTCERNVLAEQPAETHALLSALRHTAFEPGVKLVRLLHHDPGRYSSFGGLTETPRHTIGRSMYETDSVPAQWVDLCNDASLVDEVWVPSRFNALTFAQAGVDPSRLQVLPEPVDTALFSPQSATPALVASPLVTQHEHAIVTLMPELAGLVRPSTTVYLSVFKWETRKGWDLLLAAFFAEFGEQDDVILLLRTKPEHDGRALTDYQVSFRCDNLTPKDQPGCRRDAFWRKARAGAPKDGNGNALMDEQGRPLYGGGGGGGGVGGGAPENTRENARENAGRTDGKPRWDNVLRKIVTDEVSRDDQDYEEEEEEEEEVGSGVLGGLGRVVVRFSIEIKILH